MIFPQPFPTAESSEPQLSLFDLAIPQNNIENDGAVKVLRQKDETKNKNEDYGN
jgi:hypothetical protein